MRGPRECDTCRILGKGHQVRVTFWDMVAKYLLLSQVRALPR